MDEDRGFTLIELMIVVLVIAILLAIAVPTFLGARERANDRAAQSALRNTLTNELTYYADHQQFTESEGDLESLDSSIDYIVPPASVPAGHGVYVEVINGTTIILGARTPGGRCFWIRNVGDTNLPRFGSDDCTSDPTTLVYGDSW